MQGRGERREGGRDEKEPHVKRVSLKRELYYSLVGGKQQEKYTRRKAQVS